MESNDCTRSEESRYIEVETYLVYNASNTGNYDCIEFDKK